MIKYLRLSFIKKILLIVSVLFIIVLAILFNPYGIPTFLKNKLLEQLRYYKVMVNCNEIVINPFTGISFVGVRGSYEIPEGALFVQADKLSVQFSFIDLAMGDRKVESIFLSGALASFYLKKSKDHYTVNEATGVIEFHNRSIEISDSRMVVAGIPLEVKGVISNLDFQNAESEDGLSTEDDASEVADSGTFDQEELNDKLVTISTYLKPILDHIKENNVKKQISISFHVDAHEPKLAHVNVDADFSNLHLLKGTIKKLSLHSSYQQGELAIKKFEVHSSKGEKISGSVHYDFESKKIKGTAKVKMFPQTVMSTAKQFTDMDLSEFDLITAKHMFDINLSVPEQVISKQPTINISAFAKQFVLYGDVLAENLSVDASWKKNALYFDITKGKVNKNTDVACKGVWDISNDVVLLTFQVVGNPYFAHHFIPPEGAKRGFTGTLDLFTWNDALPPFINLSLRINYGENFNLQLMGDVRASNINMSNMKYKTISTQFEVISDDTHLGISFNKIDAVDQHNREMHGSIFYTIPPDGDYGKLTIDANTEVPVDEILQSFELETDFLDSMQNWQGFYAEAQGIYDIDHPERSKLKVNGKTDKLDLYGIKISKAVGSVSFNRGQVFVPRIDGLIEGTTGFGGYYYDSETDNAACNISFKGMDFEHASFNKKEDPIKGDLDLNVDVGLRFVKDVDIPVLSGQGKLRLVNTDSPLKIPVLGTLYSDLLKTISGGKWGQQLATVTADLSFANHNVMVKNLKTDGSVVAVEAEGTVFLDKKAVDFVVKALPVQNFLWKLIPTLSSPFTNNATIRVTGPFDNIEWKTEFLKSKDEN